MLGLVAVAALTWFVARRPAATTRMQFALAVPDEMSISHMALSRDGSMLVFVSPEESSALPMLFVQRVGSPNVTPLLGTQGASYPFWSPDGAYVGFFANGKLQKIAIAGGTPQALATALAGRGGSWGSKGVILFAPDAQSPLQRINADGTGMAPATQHIRTGGGPIPPLARCFFPTAIIFYSGPVISRNTKDDRVSGIYASSLEGKGKDKSEACRPLPFEF